MAAAPRDVRSQTDISQMKTEGDGSFKRKASSFRDTIEKGGKFEPERGELGRVRVCTCLLTFLVDRYHLYVSYACRKPKFCL